MCYAHVNQREMVARGGTLRRSKESDVDFRFRIFQETGINRTKTAIFKAKKTGENRVDFFYGSLKIF